MQNNLISDFTDENCNVRVKSVYADENSPDIRECAALYLLETEYGLDAKLRIKSEIAKQPFAPGIMADKK